MNQVFLPMVMMAFALTGVQDETLGSYAARYAPHSAVHIRVLWGDIEREYGIYDWSGLDVRMARMPEDVNLILGVKVAPLFARKHLNVCSQPWPVYYDNFGQFLQALVERYHPWGVELWNEPDIPPHMVSLDNWLAGCWDSGAAYAEMLDVVYPMVAGKTKVIAGALMLDEWTYTWASEALAGGDFDYASYHAYANQDPDTWDVIGTKAELIRRWTDKPILVTETAVLGPACDAVQLAAKRDYLQHVLENAWRWQIDGFLWYTIGGNGWRCSDLYPGPAYELFMDVFERQE